MTPEQRVVLIVDDDAQLLRGLERLLRHEPFTLLTAVSAAEATAILARQHVDVLVSDNQMPGMTGVKFLGTVREKYPRVVAIMLSGNISLPAAHRVETELGVRRLLHKPCAPETLVATIYEALGYVAGCQGRA